MRENQRNTPMPLRNYASAMLAVFTGNLGTMTNIVPTYLLPLHFLNGILWRGEIFNFYEI